MYFSKRLDAFIAAFSSLRHPRCGGVLKQEVKKNYAKMYSIDDEGASRAVRNPESFVQKLGPAILDRPADRRH